MIDVPPPSRPFLLVLAALLGFGAAPPQTLSPGSLREPAPVGSACPVFSWSPAPDARCQELMVLPVDGDDEDTSERRPLLRKTLPGGASSWTPPGLACFEEGRIYAWAMRSSCGNESSVWSEPRLFEIPRIEQDISVDQALRVLEAYAAQSERVEPGSVGPTGTGEVGAIDLKFSPSAGFEATPDPASAPTDANTVTLEPGSLVIEGDYAFSAPSFENRRVSAFAFTLGDEDPDVVVRRSTAGFLWIEAGLMLPYEVYLSADILLPRSSTAIYFTCYLYDNSAADLTGYAKLHRRHSGSLTREEIASVDLGTEDHQSTEIVPRSTNPSLLEETSNLYYYFIELNWNPGATGQDLRFYGCNVMYQAQLLAP